MSKSLCSSNKWLVEKKRVSKWRWRVSAGETPAHSLLNPPNAHHKAFAHTLLSPFLLNPFGSPPATSWMNP